MNVATRVSLIAGISFALSACGGPAPEAQIEDESPLTQLDPNRPVARALLEAYARAAAANVLITCPSASWVVGGFILVYDAQTGRFVAVAGIADVGTLTVPGASGTERSASGALAVGSSASWNGSSLDLGAAFVGAMTMDAGTDMPASQADAEALFDELYGPDSRHGVQLDHARAGDGGAVVAYFGRGTTTVTGPDGGSAEVSIAVAIARLGGRVYAFHTTGGGAMASKVESLSAN